MKSNLPSSKSVTSLDIGSDGEAETRWLFYRMYYFSRKITFFFKYRVDFGGQDEVSQQNVPTVSI